LSADILVVIGSKEWGTSTSGYFGFWSAHFQGFYDRPPARESHLPLVFCSSNLDIVGMSWHVSWQYSCNGNGAKLTALQEGFTGTLPNYSELLVFNQTRQTISLHHKNDTLDSFVGIGAAVSLRRRFFKSGLRASSAALILSCQENPPSIHSQLDGYYRELHTSFWIPRCPLTKLQNGRLCLGMYRPRPDRKGLAEMLDSPQIPPCDETRLQYSCPRNQLLHRKDCQIMESPRV
jgi:hypothetical protein